MFCFRSHTATRVNNQSPHMSITRYPTWALTGTHERWPLGSSHIHHPPHQASAPLPTSSFAFPVAGWQATSSASSASFITRNFHRRARRLLHSPPLRYSIPFLSSLTALLRFAGKPRVGFGGRPGNGYCSIPLVSEKDRRQSTQSKFSFILQFIPSSLLGPVRELHIQF